MRVELHETKTTPLVIHANGKSKRSGDLYKKIETTFLESSKSTIDPIDDLTIVTWKGGKYADTEMILEKCMSRYGQELVTLPWPNTTNFWEGSKYKINGTLEYLRGIDTKYFMWFDVSDVILLESPSNILSRYKEHFDGKLVFNAERNHYPKENRQTEWSSGLKSQYKSLEQYDNTFDSSFRYMNTGCCVGETALVIEFLENCKKWMGEKVNDTVAGRLAQREMESQVVVDRNCELFVCLYNVEPNEVTIYE